MENDTTNECETIRPLSPSLQNFDDGLSLTFADEISTASFDNLNEQHGKVRAPSVKCYEDAIGTEFVDFSNDQSNDICDDDELLSAEKFNIDAFMEDFLLDSIAVQFHPDVFFVQFICHIFFPLAYFLINFKGQGFEITYDFLIQPRFYLNIVTTLVIYAMVLSYFMCPVEDQRPISGALWVPLIFFIQHRLPEPHGV